MRLCVLIQEKERLQSNRFIPPVSMFPEKWKSVLWSIAKHIQTGNRMLSVVHTLSLNATWLCVRQQTVFITQISGAELHTPIIMLARHYQVKLPLSRLCTFIIAQLLCRCRRCRYLSVHVHDLSLFLSSQTPLPAIVVSRDLILVAP